jgi:hypothetical protein
MQPQSARFQRPAPSVPLPARNAGARASHTEEQATFPWPIWGSFPYHPSSSICLAALHSGILNETLGSTVWVERFFSVEWDRHNVTVYPYDSLNGSLSQGVQSHPVSEAEMKPLTLQSFSCVVHSRGTVFSQRRIAPWTPRAGHQHISLNGLVRVQYPPAYSPSFNISTVVQQSLHLIIGGKNETHYNNEVWAWVHDVDFHNESALAGEWHRLPNAPFSPRAHMAQTTKSQQMPQLLGNTDLAGCIIRSPGTDAWMPLVPCFLNITIIGGEDGVACGLLPVQRRYHYRR